MSLWAFGLIDSDVFDFVERCRKHTATGPLLSDLLETVRNLGFEHLILSGVPLGGQKLAPMVELNGWPAGWFDRYVEAEHAAVDGVCIYSAKTLKPFVWADVPAKWSATEGSRRVAGEATEFGICSGFAVPMLSVHHWQSVLSFASSQKTCATPASPTGHHGSVRWHVNSGPVRRWRRNGRCPDRPRKGGASVGRRRQDLI
ncbi:autoinducer binding domain-containing protein [Mesorhizobium sp. ESP-6-4]|uniref:autoinducer binding domain-containing protein n=1 Tax=Mesorhizobium sp. ESP-6-4 TaxID=2876624 RepID=UPI002961FD6F|nr:autoinducer binding domain-containing protein [Mesorhizobium sp. ESP-6-4]